MVYFSSWRAMQIVMDIDMKQFVSFVSKEFHHIFRDRTTMAILLLLPILMLILFGYAINTEIRNTRIAIYDPSNDEATRAIAEKLDASEYFTVIKYLNHPADVELEFLKGSVQMVVSFSQNFYENMTRTGDAQIALITDGTDPNSAKTIATYATSILGQYQQEKFRVETVPYHIDTHLKLLYNPQMKGAYNFVPGVMGMILMLICAMMTSISIAREKEMGTMEVLLVSPVKRLVMIIAKTIPYFFLSLVNLATILLLSVFLLGVPIAGSFFWLIVLSLIYLFVNLSLGLVISSFAQSQLVALLMSGMVLMIPVIMLSGLMFPVENMPKFFQVLSQIIPAKWYIVGVKKIMIKGLSLSAITLELGILLGMAVMLIGISLKKFKHRLE